MASERSLATLLRALQSSAGDQDASRLLGSAATLLTLLSNPRNLILLTHQTLSAPAIWERPDGLNTTYRVLGAFNSAAVQVLDRDLRQSASDHEIRRDGITKDEWLRTVVKGADHRTPCWKHLLVLGGLLIGFEAQGRHGMSFQQRDLLENAVVSATNLALEDEMNQSELALHTVCLVIGHTFNLLDRFKQREINHEKLLPSISRALYSSKDGLQWGYFIGNMDADVAQNKNLFNWSTKSSTFYQVQKISSSPLVASMASLSRIMAFCAESTLNANVFFKLVEDILAFTRSLCVQWRQNKLSELDSSEEETYLQEESLKVSLPVLWQLLKSSLFSVIVIQSSILARLMGDGLIPQRQHIIVAVQTLHALRNLYFISSRVGQSSFSQYTFVYTTAVDILSRLPMHAEAFLRDIRPETPGQIPLNPHSRCMDLFFLNTAEVLSRMLPPMVNDNLLVTAAAPYTVTNSDSRLMELFEAAHSVMLAIFSSPHNSTVTSKRLPAYIGTLFNAFPRSLSPRQFRLAIKTLVRVTSAPFEISETQPLFPLILLEMVRSRAENASTDKSLPLLDQKNLNAINETSEQSTLVFALIESLSVLPYPSLGEWLSLTASAINNVSDKTMLEQCQQRLWEVLSNGEMDVARAETCLAWWNFSGRRSILNSVSEHYDEPFMSGALPEQSKL